MASTSTRPAFTLLEVVVASTMMIIVASVAVGVLGQAYQTQAEGAVRNQLARDAQLVVDTLSRDLAYAGVGVPRGYRAEAVEFTAPLEPHQLRPIFRRFKPDHLAFVGDLPYPNADINGVVDVVNIDQVFFLGPTDNVAVTSALSGCTPAKSSSGNYRCATQNASLLLPSGLSADLCGGSGSTAARTCPWSLNTWQEGSRDVHLIFGGADHSWYEREWDLSSFDTTGPYRSIHLSHAAPSGSSFNTVFLPLIGGPPSLPTNRFFTPRGGGFAAQLDRVFWSLENPGAPGTACSSTTSPFCVLRRRQCFGAVIDPGNANFPAVGDTAFRANATPTECAPATKDGTDWEEIITGVRAIDFKAFDGQDNLITGTWDLQNAAKVKSVSFDLLLERRVPGTTRTLQYRASKRVWIQNRGGILGAAVVDGGCDLTLDPGNCGGDEG